MFCCMWIYTDFSQHNCIGRWSVFLCFKMKVEDCNTGVTSLNSDSVWSAVHKNKTHSSAATEIITCFLFWHENRYMKIVRQSPSTYNYSTFLSKSLPVDLSPLLPLSSLLPSPPASFFPPSSVVLLTGLLKHKSCSHVLAQFYLSGLFNVP